MTHTYAISGMTCAGCQAKVKHLLEQHPGVTGVIVDLEQGTAEVSMSRHIPAGELRSALKDYPKYLLQEMGAAAPATSPEDEAAGSWWHTYKPVLLIFCYLTGITLLAEFVAGSFRWERWMNHFMAGFFLVFSFFKMLDLRGFAESYFSYDLIARRWMGWGYVYAFVELGLGLSYLSGFQPLLTNAVAFVVMSVSIAGVLRSVLSRKKIRCACLGAVFNLPMSTITIIEDGLMILMSGMMLLRML